MSNPSPFTPGATATLAVGVASANVALPPGAGTRFLLQNAGTQQFFFVAGNSSVAATSAGTPLVAGASKVFTLDPAATNIAAIMGGGGTSSVLYVTRGEGN